MALDPNLKMEDTGEQLTADQADKIAPTVPEDSLEAAFAKLGGKKVRGATPKSAESVEPDPEKFAAFGGKFVGKTPERAEEIRNAPLAEAPAASAIPENSPFHDHVSRVLNTHGQALDIGTKGDLWDAFNQSRSSQELATALVHPSFDHVSNDIKHELYLAHAAAQPVPSHTDKVVDVLKRMSAMDAKTLQVAEKHPTILRLLVSGKE